MMKHAVLGLAAMVFAGAANASLVPSLTGGPTWNGSSYTYTYTATLDALESLDPAATTGVTCPGPGNTLVQCNPVGTFLTIYDIGGLVSGSEVTPGSDWSWTEQASGITPSTINGATFDGALPNITFYYTGPVVTGPNSFTFSFDSNSNQTVTSTYSAQLTSNDGSPSSGNTDQADGPVVVPTVAAGVPEPGSILLLGTGLIVFSTVSRKLMRK